MPTLDELFNRFSSAGEGTPTTSQPAVVGDGHNKLASEGDKNMNSLQDIYMAIAGQDQVKTAAAAAHVPTEQSAGDLEDLDFAKMASDLAEQEAEAQIQAATEEQPDIVKVAAEYDSAGRIMARGFFDEFMKLASNVSVADNQNTETESAAKTPAFGDRSLPTLATNYVGTVSTSTPGSQPQMNGPEPKKNYATSLEPAKTINAGVTGDDPEAAATSLGGGSPAGGFATVRDLQA